MLGVFLVYVKFDSEVFIQIFLFIMGVFGLLASNPLSIVWRPRKTRVADHLLPAFFIAAYRMFLVLEMNLLAARKSVVSPRITILLVVAFGLYAALEGSASYDRAVSTAVGRPTTTVLLSSERIAVWGHGIYVFVSVLSFSIAGRKFESGNIRRFTFFGLSIFLSGTVTIVTRVYLVIRLKHVWSIVPGLFYSAVHATLVAMALFFMHHAGGMEYKVIENELLEAANTGLDIEEISEGEDSEDGFRDEELEDK
jgi:hypothetical protein